MRNIFVIFSIFMIFGCSKNGSVPPSAPSHVPQTVAPTVTLLSPQNKGVDVSRITSFQLQFSEAVVGVDSQSVSLRMGTPDGPSVSLAAPIPGNQNTYTFNLLSELTGQTNYFIVVSDSIRSRLDQAALTPNSFYFTTGDFSYPVVTLISPVANADGVASHPTVQFLFSRPVNGVDTTSVTLNEGSPTGPAVTLDPIAGNDGKILYTLTPSSTLKDNTKYYLNFSQSIQSANGIPLLPTQFAFSVSSNLAYLVDQIPGIVSKTTVYRCTVNSADGSFENCEDSGFKSSTSAKGYIFWAATAKGFVYLVNKNDANITRCAVEISGHLTDCIILTDKNLDPNLIHGVLFNATGTVAYIAALRKGIVTCPVKTDGTFGTCTTTPISFGSDSLSGFFTLTMSSDGSVLYFGGSQLMYACDVGQDGVLSSCNLTPWYTLPSHFAINAITSRATTSGSYFYAAVGTYFVPTYGSIVQCSLASNKTFENCQNDTFPGLTMTMPVSIDFQTLANNATVAYITNMYDPFNILKCQVGQNNGQLSSCSLLVGLPAFQGLYGMTLLPH